MNTPVVSSPINRVFVIVLDSAGVGFLPDAGEYGDSAVALYSAIMSISRARQHNMLKSGGVLRDLEQNSPKTLKADPRVICQGAAGAFSGTVVRTRRSSATDRAWATAAGAARRSTGATTRAAG